MSDTPTPEESSAVETKGDAMSDDLVTLARRWSFWPAEHYDGCEADHVGCLVAKLANEVERLQSLLTEESKSLAKLIDSMTSQLRATADRVTGERDAARAERDAVQVEVERLKNAIDHLTSERDEARDERDAAQRERDRVQDLLTLAGRELSTLREALRVRRRDQSAQNLDMANGQAILDSSRPTDEDIWREVFFRCVSEYITGEKRVIIADTMLAEYRKRWPR